MNLPSAAVLIPAILSSSPAAAKDGAFQERGGQIAFVEKTEIAIASEDLDVRREGSRFRVLAKYVMENSSHTALLVKAGFPLPECSFEDFIDFWSSATVDSECSRGVAQTMRLTIDGVELTPRQDGKDFVYPDYRIPANLSSSTDVDMKPYWTLLARYRGQDVTTLIAEPLAEFMSTWTKLEREKKHPDDTEVWVPIHARIASALGVKKPQQGNADLSELRVQSVFLWNHRFAPGKKVTMEHEYHASAGGSASALPFEHYRDRGDIARYCLAEGSAKKAFPEAIGLFHKASAGKEIAWRELIDELQPRAFEYLLQPARFQGKTIGRFTLTIHKSNPQEMVSTCFPGLERIGPSKLRATIRNYTPNQSLRILVFPSPKRVKERLAPAETTK